MLIPSPHIWSAFVGPYKFRFQSSWEAMYMDGQINIMIVKYIHQETKIWNCQGHCMISFKSVKPQSSFLVENLCTCDVGMCMPPPLNAYTCIQLKHIRVLHHSTEFRFFT